MLVCIAIVAAAEQEGMQFVLYVCVVAVGGFGAGWFDIMMLDGDRHDFCFGTATAHVSFAKCV